MEILKLGSKGESVKKIQIALKLTPDGIFGPKTAEAVKKFQKANGLKVDGIVGQITYNKLLGINNTSTTSTSTTTNSEIPSFITKGYINVHITKLVNRPIKYIAIHYTAGGSSKVGTALSVRNVFLKRNASADFVVDDGTIVQINPDIKNYYTWSVGDKKNPYTGGGKLAGKATNKNTISIEICSNLKKGYSANAANHEGWYFTQESINNALKLTKYLMKTYNIPKENVIRHFDVSGKLCPGIVGWNDFYIYDKEGKQTKLKSNSSKWEKFYSQL